MDNNSNNSKDTTRANNSTNSSQPSGQNIYVNSGNPQNKNGLGTAGFVLALIALFTDWIPFAGWIVWIVGAVLSIIGIFHEPKGLAIAGTIISFIGFIILTVFAGAILSAM